MEEFIIQKKFKEGSSGQVFLVSSKQTQEHLVMKEIPLFSMTEQEINDARKEVEILSLLKHPCIIGYKGHFIEQNKLYILMEYATGGDLRSAIKNQKGTHFSEETILNWFVEICLALKYLHDRKILHRDIKCQNIFLMKNGLVKLGDFGIAKILGYTTELSITAVGTPYYLSPEICQGKPYNAKSDVWSLGCVLYELCTLKYAFDAYNMNSLIMKILRAKQTPIHFHYSQYLKNLVGNLLDKNPMKRPSVNQILKRKFIRSKIINLFGRTFTKNELIHTVFHGFAGGITPPELITQTNSGPVVKEALNLKKPTQKSHSKPTSREKVSPRKNQKSEHKKYQRKIPQTPSLNVVHNHFINPYQIKKSSGKKSLINDQKKEKTKKEDSKKKKIKEIVKENEMNCKCLMPSSSYTEMPDALKMQRDPVERAQSEICFSEKDSQITTQETTQSSDESQPFELFSSDLPANVEVIEPYDEDDDMKELAAIAQDLLVLSSGEDDDNVVEDQDESFRFQYQGKELKLHYVTDLDSMNFRVEAIRDFIEQSLGIDVFIEVYNFVNEKMDSLSPLTIQEEINKILVNDDQKPFFTLIQQLIVCEETIAMENIQKF